MKKNLSSFYNYIKTQNRKVLNIPIIKFENRLIIEDEEKCNVFNQYFESNFINDNGKMSSSCSSNSNFVLQNVCFEPFIVYNYLLKLSNSFSAGPDKVPNIILKKCALTLAEPLSIIYEVSFRTNQLPNDWLKSVVIPIFKNKGSRDNIENYRPISLTCTSCRVMEKIIKDSIINSPLFKQISSCQHGFRVRKSTTTQLLESIRDWVEVINQKQNIDIVYIDFAKAFDTVSHVKMIQKLDNFGLKGNLLNWMNAFLTYRHQQVKINNNLSNYCFVKSGVPQGSVLGPLLFLIYVNDVCNIQTSFVKFKLFADDLKIYRIVNTVEDYSDLQAKLTEVRKWSEDWQLKINTSKCVSLHLGSKNQKFDYMLNNVLIPSNQNINDLGVIISSDMKFSFHINSIKSKAFQRLHLLFRYFRSKNYSLLLNAYKVFIRPILEYNTVIWNPYLLKDIDTLEGVQRYFTKRLMNNQFSYPERLCRLNLEFLEKRRIIFDLIYCFKILNKYVDLDSTKFFKLSTNTHTRGHQFKLILPKSNLNCHKYFFKTRVVPIWNNLSNASVNCSSVTSFKNKIAQIQFSLRGHASVN